MKLYGGIDLHSNNSVIALLDETDQRIYRNRLPKGKSNPKLKCLSGKLEARRMREACNLKKILKGRWKAFAQARRPWRLSLP